MPPFTRRSSGSGRCGWCPFDVPGHKHGRGNPELTAFLGQQCVAVDVNSMKPLDNLCHPISVIREAEELAAEALRRCRSLSDGGRHPPALSRAWCSPPASGADKIILPRNVHRSVINALVLCGAYPGLCKSRGRPPLGISLGMRREQVEKGHCGASRRRGGAGEQPHLLRRVQRPAVPL